MFKQIAIAVVAMPLLMPVSAAAGTGLNMSLNHLIRSNGLEMGKDGKLRIKADGVSHSPTGTTLFGGEGKLPRGDGGNIDRKTLDAWIRTKAPMIKLNAGNHEGKQPQ